MQPKTRLKQKLTQRTLVIATVFFLSAITLGIMIFIQLKEPQFAYAKNTTEVNVIVIKDHELVIDKSLDEPRLVSQTVPQANAIFVRPVNIVRENSSN